MKPKPPTDSRAHLAALRDRRARPSFAPLAAALAAAFGLCGCVVEGDDVYLDAPLPEAGGSGGSGGGGGGGGAMVVDTPGWSDIEPIMVEKCGACHGATPSQGAPYPLVDYDNAKLHADRSAFRSKLRTMPPPGSPALSDGEIALIVAWAEAGAPETVGPAPTVWATVEPIMVAKCGGCHGATPSGGAPYPLVDFENAALHAERSAIRAEADTMPPPGLGYEMCTADEKAVLRAWADAGAPKE